MEGGGANRGVGHKFQFKQIEGRGKISVQAFRGGAGQNFSALTFEGHPEATINTIKILAAAAVADIFHNTVQPSYFMPTLRFQDLPMYDSSLR